jgi:outer membrane cobalamin receptor
MRGSKLITMAAALAIVTVVATKASARTPRDSSDDDRYAYVLVTGSNIPQKVRIKPIGTTTTSPIRVYNRHEIDQMGRFTTEEVLRQDPSLSVHGFGQAGPND